MTEESYTDDNADVSQLEQRIDELEDTIRNMLPSRREAIGMGVAGLAGASLMSGTASAGSAQVGTIGDNSNLVDLVAEDVTITDTLNTASLSGAAADEALLSDGSGNLTFGSVGGVEEVSTFGNLPTIDPPQLAYVIDEDEYYHSNAGLGFDISVASFTTSINTQDSTSEDIAWNDDGSRLYESAGDKIYQNTVSTPFDIATASFDTSINTNNNEAAARGLAFSNDGTKMVVLIQSPDIIQQYDLSTGFDISTASFDVDIPTQDTIPRGIAWNDDGSRLYESGNTSGGDIYQSTLSTPFDISTASFSTSITSQDGHPRGIAWNDDGSRLYEVGDTQNQIYQYTVSTAFDISSASFSTSISTQDSSPQGIAWNNDGSRLYEVGNGSGGDIYQYAVNTGGWEAF